MKDGKTKLFLDFGRRCWRTRLNYFVFEHSIPFPGAPHPIKSLLFILLNKPTAFRSKLILLPLSLPELLALGSVTRLMPLIHSLSNSTFASSAKATFCKFVVLSHTLAALTCELTKSLARAGYGVILLTTWLCNTHTSTSARRMGNDCEMQIERHGGLLWAIVWACGRESAAACFQARSHGSVSVCALNIMGLCALCVCGCVWSDRGFEKEIVPSIFIYLFIYFVF